MSGHAIILALALTLTADPPAPAPTSASAGSERICRGGGQRRLGSHVRTPRRCLTAGEWAREDEARRGPAPGLQVTAGQNDGGNTATPR